MFHCFIALTFTSKTFCLNLPYKQASSFAQVKNQFDQWCSYVIISHQFLAAKIYLLLHVTQKTFVHPVY